MDKVLLQVGDPVRYVGPSARVLSLDDLRQVPLVTGMSGHIVDRWKIHWVVEFGNAYRAAVGGHLEKWEH
jgi:hypothetical protein